MKKLTYLVSAIAAAFSANAYADISVSGSAGLGYINDATGDNNLQNSAAISFAMSTTTSGGLGISASLGLSVSPTAENDATGTGGQTLTFTTGGSTVKIGDIEVADTPGSVGGAGVSANTVESSALSHSVAGGFADDDGQGVLLSTGVGAATVTVGHIWSTGADNDARVNVTDATADATAFGVSLPVGAWTLSAGTATHNDTAESSGVSVSGAVGGGTLTVGYGTQKTPAKVSATYTNSTAAGDANVMGASYTMALDADTSVSIGYQNKKDQDDDKYTRIDASASRSLGGGASVYIDMRSLTSSTATQAGTAFGFGTSVSF
jgi:hypothetical protein